MANQFINDNEQAACQENGVAFVENLLAFEGIVALISSDVTTTLTCTDLTALDQLYGIGAQGTPVDLQTLSPADEATSLILYAPAAGSKTYELIRSLLPSGELRSDFTTYNTAQDLSGMMTSAEGHGIALMSYIDYNNLENKKGLKTLQFMSPTGGNCQSPTLTNFEANNYPALRPLMFYISETASKSETVRALVNFAASEAG